jgi:PAS domain S-box-containing protein
VIRIDLKSFFFRYLRRVPMPVIAIAVGLAAGLAVWGVLEQIQSRQVKKIFDEELHSRLNLRSRESLMLFDQYLANYAATTRLLANHRRLAEYLQPVFWSFGDEVRPRFYATNRPPWLSDFFERNALAPPSHVLLVDANGRTREIYQARDDPLPEELAESVGDHLLGGGEVRTVLTAFGDRFFLVVSDAVEDARGFGMGSLVVLVPVDRGFLAASQRGVSFDDAAIALVDSEEQRILVTVDTGVLMPDTPLSQWTDEYLITSQSLPQYEGSDWNLLLATFISHASVDKMSRHVRHFERRQRGIAALVFITVFTLVIYLVSARLNKVLRRMSDFSHRALGIEQPGFRRGANRLILLEEWIQQFTKLVLRAREEMSHQHAIAIRESEALKAAVMEASLDSIVTLDRKGAVIDFNPTAERALGLDRKEVLGQTFSRLFLAGESREIFLGLLKDSRRARREGHILKSRTELTARRANGTSLPVELSIVPISLDDKLFYTLYMHDITKRRQAEREIKSLARFAAESPNPILRVNPEGVVVYANPASLPMLEGWETGLGGALPSAWITVVSEALDGGRNLEREDELGGQVYSLLFAPIRELGYVNIYARDITAVRRAEQEARQHQAELVHVCRLSTMGEVATGMAHELNQPLSAIVNFANGVSRRLQGGLGSSQDFVETMGQIASQAQRAGEIIRRLRTLVGKQPPVRSRVDLNHLVREVCSFVEFETSKMGLSIGLDLSSGEIPVDVDLVQIEQVLLNLVRNALDALDEVPAEKRRLSIRTRITPRGAEVAVEDSGPGVPPERRQQLFDPFYTTKETGMGMGLPISQTIIENHAGDIRAEFTPGGGATFRVRLPVAEMERLALRALGGV